MGKLIDKDAAIDAVEFGITYATLINIETGEKTRLFVEINEELQKAVERIKKLPTVEPKRGRWINYPECLRYDGAYCVEHIVCSNCESVWNIIDNDADRFDYCPHCGADMREGGEWDETD